MRPQVIMAVAALAVASACGSSGGHASSSKTPGARTGSPAATPAGAPVARADVPGFSGAVDPSHGDRVTHAFGRCLQSWYTRSGSGTRVHVGYPGPADISVDLMITDQSEPPPEAHHQLTMPAGQQVKDVRFPVIPHAGFPQITVISSQRTLVCDVPAR